MKLFILRHAHALGIGEAGVASDAERPLSPQGRQDAARMARHLAQQGAAPRLILTSPLKRARQTADEVSRILKPRTGIRVFEPLSNKIPGNALSEQLRAETDELLVVGHQPQLGEMVAHLTGKTVELRPAGLVAIEIKPDAPAKLLWSKNP